MDKINWNEIKRDYPHIELSLIQDMYRVMKDWSDEKQEDYIKAYEKNDWKHYLEKYNIELIEEEKETPTEINSIEIKNFSSVEEADEFLKLDRNL